MRVECSIALSLAIKYILKLADGAGLVHFGIKCGSFCGLNRGTSGRSACSPLGYTGLPSVAASNKLLERTVSSYVGLNKINTGPTSILPAIAHFKPRSFLQTTATSI